MEGLESSLRSVMIVVSGFWNMYVRFTGLQDGPVRHGHHSVAVKRLKHTAREERYRKFRSRRKHVKEKLLMVYEIYRKALDVKWYSLRSAALSSPRGGRISVNTLQGYAYKYWSCRSPCALRGYLATRFE